MHADNPWSALQAAGVEATDAPPAGVRIAYADEDEVGFDSAMALPPVCLTCAAPELQGTRDLKLRASRLPFGPSARRTLRVPECTACRALRRRENIASWLVAIILPVGLICLLLLYSYAPVRESESSVIQAAPLAYLLLWAGTFVYRNRLRGAVELALLRLDDDGFVKLGGVHPGAGQAIVSASGIEAPTAPACGAELA